MHLENLSPNLFVLRDTCNVYVIRAGAAAILVDFGSGAVLDELPGLGIEQVSAILMTHHHRDQGQGLPRAVAKDIPIWAPHSEQDLFHSVGAHWQARPLLHNYDVRQDRFSLLEPVPLADTLKDYGVYWFGERRWSVLPAPGHTQGSLALLVEVDGRRLAFTGDLIAGAGKVWSMAALQWSYNGQEGAAAEIPALLSLCERQPDWLLPSHGEIMAEPKMAIDLLVERLRALLQARGENPSLDSWLREPYQQVTPHLLVNRTSLSNSYVLLSESGQALLIDYGYDFFTGNSTGPDREIHRPWLYSLGALKRDFGVHQVEVVLPTHYHDDHVAGFNLLRDVEGTQVWAAENFAPILEHPQNYDLPCLWFDPIPVDRVLALGQPIQWQEYTLMLYPLPGHTRYAVAIAVEVDGHRVLATGDQYEGNDSLDCNYVYQNRFEHTDFIASAALYEQLSPDLILTGHWKPLWVQPGFFEELRQRGERIAQLHEDLLPLDMFDLGAEGRAARMQPYHFHGPTDQPIAYQVEVRNPYHHPVEMLAKLVLPLDWHAEVASWQIRLEGGASRVVEFQVYPPAGASGRRFRLAVDISAGEHRLGQQAEALVDLEGQNPEIGRQLHDTGSLAERQRLAL